MSLARLIGAGTSICGASAVAAADSIGNGPEEDVAYAIGCVTLFGTVSMLIYRVIGAAIGLEPHAFGFWAGSSIHEVAQVVATGFQYGTDAGETGVVVKLSRVLLLAPLLIGMAALAHGSADRPAGSLSLTQILPVFVVGFVAGHGHGCLQQNGHRLLSHNGGAVSAIERGRRDGGRCGREDFRWRPPFS